MVKKTITGDVLSIDKLQISSNEYALLVRVKDANEYAEYDHDIPFGSDYRPHKTQHCVISGASCKYVEKYSDKEKHSFSPTVVPTAKSHQIDSHSELIKDLTVYLQRKQPSYINKILDHVNIVGEEITDERSGQAFIIVESIVLYNSDNEILPDLATDKNN